MRDPIQIITSFTDSVSSVTCSDHEIVAGCIDGRLRYFDIAAGRLKTDHIAQPITSARLSTDGQCALISCLDSTVRLMDKTSGGLLAEYKSHKHHSYSIESCFTNTEAHVLSGSEDGKIYIWKIVEATLVHTLQAHSKEVVSLDYHPNDVSLLSASADGTIKLWVA